MILKDMKYIIELKIYMIIDTKEMKLMKKMKFINLYQTIIKIQIKEIKYYWNMQNI